MTWQRQVLGISALVSPHQPTRFALAMESFLFEQIRVAQVRTTAAALNVLQELTLETAHTLACRAAPVSFESRYLHIACA